MRSSRPSISVRDDSASSAARHQALREPRLHDHLVAEYPVKHGPDFVETACIGGAQEIRFTECRHHRCHDRRGVGIAHDVLLVESRRIAHLHDAMAVDAADADVLEDLVIDLSYLGRLRHGVVPVHGRREEREERRRLRLHRGIGIEPEGHQDAGLVAHGGEICESLLICDPDLVEHRGRDDRLPASRSHAPHRDRLPRPVPRDARRSGPGRSSGRRASHRVPVRSGPGRSHSSFNLVAPRPAWRAVRAPRLVTAADACPIRLAMAEYPRSGCFRSASIPALEPLVPGEWPGAAVCAPGVSG